MKQLNRIKIVLVEQNKTAKWLSEQIGKNTCSVSRWCTNTSQPDLEILFSYCGTSESRCEGFDLY